MIGQGPQGLQSIITLSVMLALGFLLVILSCALYSNWLPLQTLSVFLIAPLPQIISSRYSQADDLLSDSATSSVATMISQYLLGALLVTGLALPLVLVHASLILPIAGIMSFVGGILVYTAVIFYVGCFSTEESQF